MFYSFFSFVFKTDDANTRRLIKKVRDSGARVFINTLWPELCGGHDDDRAVELKHRQGLCHKGQQA